MRGRPSSLVFPHLRWTSADDGGSALNEWLTALLEAVADLGALRYVVAGVGIFCETSVLLGLIVPGDSIVLATATAGRGVAEWVLLVAVVIIGSLGGESVGFAIGRFLGPRLRTSRLGRRIGERQILRTEQWIERRGGVAVFVSRFLPVLHALTPVTVGASGFPFRRFMAWTVPACVLWSLLYVTVGTLAGSSYRALADEFDFAGWIVIGGLVVFAVVVLLGKRLLGRLERR